MALVDTQEVKLAINAETSGQAGVTALAGKFEEITLHGGALDDALKKAQKELLELGQTGRRIEVLNRAVENLNSFKTGLVTAKDKVRELEVAYSEALNSNIEAPGLKNLEKQLAAAKNGAEKADAALLRSHATVGRLNLEGINYGITSEKMADASVKLASDTARVTAKIEALKQGMVDATQAEKDRISALRQQGSEEDRLADIVAASKAKIAQAAKDQLFAEKRAYTESEAAAKRYVETTRAIAAGVDNAFSTVGIRSAKAIQAEITSVQRSLQRLAASSTTSGAEFNRAWVAGQSRIAALKVELSGVNVAANTAASSISGMGASIRSLAGPLAGMAIASEFLSANTALESTVRTFTALTGSSELAAKELAYVSKVADRLGINVISAAQGYAQLAASTKGSAVEGQATRDVFEAVSRAMSIAGKSTDDTNGALLALSQMASKGVVAMEELRGQLGERLPGALKAAADGLGITTGELIALVETGRMTADEIFPALAKGLGKIYSEVGKGAGAVEILTQEWEHFKNTATSAFQSLGEAGGLDALKWGLEGLGAAVVIAETSFLSLGKSIGTFFAALANGDVGLKGFSEKARQAFAEIEKEAQDKLVGAAMHNRVLAASLDESGKKALEAARAQEKLASGTSQAGAAAEQSGAGWTKLNVIYGELQKKADQVSKQAEKSAEARKIEATNSSAVARAFGTEEEKRVAVASAANVEAAALAEVSRLKQAELGIAQSQLAALLAEIEARGSATEQQQKVIDKLRTEIETRQAAADKASAQATASALVAAQAQVESKAIADNSARLNELRTAYEAATAKVAQLRAAKAAGIDVTQQLAAAEIAAGQAALLHRDALVDLREKIDAVRQQKLAEISVDEAGVRLAIARQRSIYEVARARGDEVRATQAMLDIKRLEIELAELTAKAKQAEAEAAKQLALAKIEEIKISGTMTDAKRAEIAALEAGVRVKQIEAEIAGVAAEGIRDLVRETELSAQSASKAADGYNELAESLKNVAGNADRAKNRVAGIWSDDFTAPGAALDVAALAKNFGLDGSQMDEFAQLFGKQLQVEMARMNPMNITAMNEAAAQWAAGQVKGKSAPATRHEVRITLPDNSSKVVNMADSSSADVLADVFRQLEDGAWRS